MNIKICEDCCFMKSNSDHVKVCGLAKRGYPIELISKCPLDITLKDILELDTMAENDRRNGVLYTK